jgi:hypothetical protein
MELGLDRDSDGGVTYQTTSVDPDGHGQIGSGVDAGGADDVQVQAVFRKRVANLVTAVADTVRRVGESIASAFPRAV